MLPFPLIAEVYMLCAGFGTLFVCGTALLGAGHGGSGHGGHAGDLGGHSLIGGHSGGHGPGHTGGHLGSTGGHGHIGPAGSHGVAAHTGSHGGAAHTGSHGGTQTGAHGAGAGTRIGADAGSQTAHSALQGGAKAGGSATGSQNVITPPSNRYAQSSQDQLARIILTFLNPTVISVFLALFGGLGIIFWRALPIPIEWTVPIAATSALVGTRTLLNMLGFMMSRLFCSTTYKMESIIGSRGEVTVGINNGRVGEIIYRVGVRRYTASAKATDPARTFKRDDDVIIDDLVDDIAMVSPWLADEGAVFDAHLASTKLPELNQPASNAPPLAPDE